MQKRTTKLSRRGRLGGVHVPCKQQSRRGGTVDPAHRWTIKMNTIGFDQIFSNLFIFSLCVFERVFEPLSFTSSLLVRSRQTRSIAVLSSIVVKSPTTKTGPKIFASPLPFSRSLVVAVCRQFSIQ